MGQKVTFKFMIEHVTTAYENYKNGKWSIKNVTSYLKANALSLTLIDKMTKSWITQKNNADYNLMDDIPVVWQQDYADFSTHIDTIMHTVFLGVTQKLGMIKKTILNNIKNTQHLYLQETFSNPSET